VPGSGSTASFGGAERGCECERERAGLFPRAARASLLVTAIKRPDHREIAAVDRFINLLRLWNHLPGFRAVAETEHLPSAAKRLGVTPSALSKNLATLERNLGRPLFERRGRKLLLNDAGREVLAQVREAMRGLDDTLQAIDSEELRGPLRVISTSRVATSLFVEALPQISRIHPHLHPSIGMAPQDPEGALLCGEADIFLSESAHQRRGLHVELLGEFRNSVYCGTSHPLADRLDAPIEEILSFPFVAPPDNDKTPDGWPVHLTRKITLRADLMFTGMQVCAQGEHLAVFPDRVVAAHAPPGKILRFDFEGVPNVPVYAIRRQRLRSSDRAEHAIAAIRDVCPKASTKRG